MVRLSSGTVECSLMMMAYRAHRNTVHYSHIQSGLQAHCQASTQPRPTWSRASLLLMESSASASATMVSAKIWLVYALVEATPIS
jgi:hypothetical protein